MHDLYDWVPEFKNKIADHDVTLEEVIQILDHHLSRWAQNRGDATHGIAGKTSCGRELYIPVDELAEDVDEKMWLRTAYPIEHSKLLFTNKDLQREHWERRKSQARKRV